MRPPRFLQELFVPRFVMAHQHEIELTQPSGRITRDMSETQKKVLELRWGLDEKSEELEKSWRPTRSTRARRSPRAGGSRRRAEIKQTHLGLLIRIKNLLTPGQRPSCGS